MRILDIIKGDLELNNWNVITQEFVDGVFRPVFYNLPPVNKPLLLILREKSDDTYVIRITIGERLEHRDGMYPYLIQETTKGYSADINPVDIIAWQEVEIPDIIRELAWRNCPTKMYSKWKEFNDYC